jgi:hypothetical protein
MNARASFQIEPIAFEGERWSDPYFEAEHRLIKAAGGFKVAAVHEVVIYVRQRHRTLLAGPGAVA